MHPLIVQTQTPRYSIEKAIKYLERISKTQDEILIVDVLPRLKFNTLHGAARDTIYAMHLFGFVSLSEDNKSIKVLELGRRAIIGEVNALQEALLNISLFKFIFEREREFSKVFSRKEIYVLLKDLHWSEFFLKTRTSAYLYSRQYLDAVRFTPQQSPLPPL